MQELRGAIMISRGANWYGPRNAVKKSRPKDTGRAQQLRDEIASMTLPFSHSLPIVSDEYVNQVKGSLKWNQGDL